MRKVCMSCYFQVNSQRHKTSGDIQETLLQYAVPTDSTAANRQDKKRTSTSH